MVAGREGRQGKGAGTARTLTGRLGPRDPQFPLLSVGAALLRALSALRPAPLSEAPPGRSRPLLKAPPSLSSARPSPSLTNLSE